MKIIILTFHINSAMRHKSLITSVATNVYKKETTKRRWEVKRIKR